MDEQLEIIETPKIIFEFGDKKFRALYGPESIRGNRIISVLVDEDYVSKLEAMLEFADAKMPKE